MSLPERTGNIKFTTRNLGMPEETVTAEWVGGPVVWISDVLMEQADPRYWKRDIHDNLSICQFQLKIIGYDDAIRCYAAERITELDK